MSYNLNAESNVRFLGEEMFEQLAEVPLEKRHSTLYQYDGCFTLNRAGMAERSLSLIVDTVREQQNGHFHRWWIGKGRSIPRSVRSKGLIPISFYVKGHMKSPVCDVFPVTNVEELRQWKINAATQIKITSTGVVMENELRERMRVYIRNGVGHFKHQTLQ